MTETRLTAEDRARLRNAPDTLTTLREKVEQWRAEAVQLRRLAADEQRDLDFRDEWQQRAAQLEQCARDIDALLSSLPPSPETRTCATCQHWCAETWQRASRDFLTLEGKDAACGKKAEIYKMSTIYIYGDGRVDDYDFDTPSTFGCAFYAPLPKEPQP